MLAKPPVVRQGVLFYVFVLKFLVSNVSSSMLHVTMSLRFPHFAVDGSAHISICVGVLDPLTTKRGKIKK